MKTTDILNICWLLVAMSTMVFIAWTTWRSHVRNKADSLDSKRRMDEMHEAHMKIARLQLDRIQKDLEGKRPWDL